MATTLDKRPFRLTTPLGPDKLLPVEMTGTEALSQLFEFRLTLLAENATKVEFDKLIGQKVLVELDLPGGKTRYFGGVVSRFSEGRRDPHFTRYTMEVVPQAWLLTRRFQSRIFQHQTVPEVLKAVLKGLDVKWDLKGKYPQRDYCVQYRESDFHFASRLMEEEGIYYYFAHSDKGHTLVVADTPEGHAEVPAVASAVYDDVRGGHRDGMRVTEWEKAQALTSGKVTLWDHYFELPPQNLEAVAKIQETAAAGKVTHKLALADNGQLEVYDYPGGYSEWFDGVDPNGGDAAAELGKIFTENRRVAKVRMEQEAAAAIEVSGASSCRQFTAGHRFALERHANADGPYVLKSVTHTVRLGADYRSGQGDAVAYENRFTGLPLALPFRPPQVTPQPLVGGSQTATVVGPPGEEIHCDKYGRVKVQFHWDRQGKKDAQSSCWVRVVQNWGGAGWGNMTIPHVGQEVVVDFEEGDPDRPLITGRVYNAECMPPLSLPGHKTKTIYRDHGGNQIIMEGAEGHQSLVLHSPVANCTLSMGAPAPSIAATGAGPGGAPADAGPAHPWAPTLHPDGSFLVVDVAPLWSSGWVGSGSGQGPPPPKQPAPPPSLPPAPANPPAGIPATHPGAPALAPSGDHKINNWDPNFDPVTVHKDGSMSLPEGQVPPGFWGRVGGAMTWMVKGPTHWDINVHETKCIHGYKEQLIVGHKADVILGYERKHVVGASWTTIVGAKAETNLAGCITVIVGGKVDNITPYERKNVLGWTQTTIVGFKREVIGGATTSLLGGKKTEVIRGSTTKVHVGKASEYRNTELDEVTPKRRELAKVAKAMHTKMDEMVEADKKVKAGGKILDQATDWFVDATSDAEIEAASAFRMVGTDLIMKGNHEIKKCGKYKAETGNYVVNSGALSVK